MAERKLPRLAPQQEKLGLPTIMDRALAARHGVAYVHLAAFAIDVDRVRDAVEGYGDPRPFGWDVLVTEQYVVERAPSTAILEDTVLSILDGEPNVLGGQLVFAIWDAIERGVLPAELRGAFRAWKARPRELVRDLARLWPDAERLVPELARSCLDVELSPPLSPPTREALERMARP